MISQNSKQGKDISAPQIASEGLDCSRPKLFAARFFVCKKRSRPIQGSIRLPAEAQIPANPSTSDAVCSSTLSHDQAGKVPNCLQTSSQKGNNNVINASWLLPTDFKSHTHIKVLTML